MNLKLETMQPETETSTAPEFAWPSRRDLLRLWRYKHGRADECGPRAAQRRRFAYFTPNDYYEAVLDSLVTSETRWLDVGCGRNLLPGNERLAETLAARCAFLQGVDPDPTIEDNELCHACSTEPIENFQSDQTFDLLTMRMVAEHIEDPTAVIKNLAKLTRVGGKVVVFTAHRWSPLSIMAAAVPHGLHHPIKRFFWDTEEEDTFPVQYLMNTKRRLTELFEVDGFRTLLCRNLSDCAAFSHFPPLYSCELAVCKALNRIGYSYPEANLLAVFERI